METKKLIVIFILALLSLSCSSHEHIYKVSSEEVLFKNFTLAVCLNMAYGESSEKLLREAAYAASGYREFSNVSLDAYDEVRNEIKKWLKKDYPSKHGGQIDIMKCIDLQNSSRIKNIFSKYDPCKTRASWLDEKNYQVKCK